MDFVNGRGDTPVVSVYVEREMSEYKRVTERELRTGLIAPEARAAFSRKPYYGASAINLKNRPVLR